MKINTPVLGGKHIRLEPLEHRHLAGLIAAAAENPSLYTWATVPQDEGGMRAYIDLAIQTRSAGNAVPFAILRQKDNAVLGSTRLYNAECWAWPKGHARHGLETPDASEAGYTWLAQSALRSPVNTEAKLLLLTYAFEEWKLLRVCFHTDVRNTRSAAAIERIGAKLEGTLRAHRLARDNIARDSLRFSILAEEWPEVKAGLERRLEAV